MGRHNQVNPYTDTATKRALKADFRCNGWTLAIYDRVAHCWFRNQPHGIKQGADGCDGIDAAYRLRDRLKKEGLWSFADRVKTMAEAGLLTVDTVKARPEAGAVGNG